MAEVQSETPSLDARARLLKAAEARFRRFGFKRTTVEDITLDAGTGKGSLYLHFPSKQAIYLAVVEASLEAFVEKATAAVRGAGDAPQRLRRLVEVTAEHYGNDELLHASLFGGDELVEGEVSRRAAALQRTRMRALLAEALRAGQREGSVRTTIDADTAAAVLFEIGWAVVRAELEGEGDLPLAVALHSLNEIVGLGLLARAGGGVD
ncbi:TetR/AcrR family transcriptional regulator [Candidatus Binatia bacterium]|nr:TetR/AcrR family transcriptional regulator [Candidatus Binatia bacterium]